MSERAMCFALLRESAEGIRHCEEALGPLVDGEINWTNLNRIKSKSDVLGIHLAQCVEAFAQLVKS